MTTATGAQVGVELLGSFELKHQDTRVRLPRGAQRLLAVLALRSCAVHRATAAELLWPDSPRSRALANLRSAVWNCRRVRGSRVVDCDGSRLQLSADVAVDHRLELERARRIARTAAALEDFDGEQAITALSKALLPDWFDDWLLVDRERWDQIRLHALETLARRLLAAENHLPALEAALAAVAIEPVRESAHRTVVEVYLAEGNSACALKHYQRYSRLVLRELGVSPSLQMTRLIDPITSA